MIRNSLKMTALGAIALLGGAIGVNCSKGSVGGGGDQGTLKIAFALPGGADSISLVNYKITATSSGTTLLQGSFNTSDPNATASLDVALPATASGATDTVVLSATTDHGVACSTAPVTFTVTSGANTNVSLSMVCGTSVPQSVPGTVDITTTVSTSNSCPSITSAVIAPAQTSVGATASVSATGADPDNDSLTYAWAPAANFASPTMAATTYTCTAAGLQTITLKISDGKCDATVPLQINCVGAGAGGTGGAAGAPATGGTTGAAGAPATGGTTGAAGAPATGGTTGAAGSGAAGMSGGTGGTSGVSACTTCEFNDSAPPLSFCAGTTTTPTTTTVAAFGCAGLTNATDVANCEALVTCLRGAACQAAIHSATADYAEAGSNFDDPHPCLCGPGVTLTTCLGLANTAFTGVCADKYLTAAGTNSILNHYGDNLSPIGLANNLMTCDVDSTVADNGLQNCGSACSLGQ
jgi:hypothetical protein